MRDQMQQLVKRHLGGKFQRKYDGVFYFTSLASFAEYLGVVVHPWGVLGPIWLCQLVHCVAAGNFKYCHSYIDHRDSGCAAVLVTVNRNVDGCHHYGSIYLSLL